MRTCMRCGKELKGVWEEESIVANDEWWAMCKRCKKIFLKLFKIFIANGRMK